jgi:hypothetical protein
MGQLFGLTAKWMGGKSKNDHQHHHRINEQQSA